MGAPGYSGTIEFPARFIDAEIKELLAKQYEVRFKEPDPRELEHELELEETVYGEIPIKALLEWAVEAGYLKFWRRP